MQNISAEVFNEYETSKHRRTQNRPTPMRVVPPIRTERILEGLTIYLNRSLNNQIPPETGVFIPNGYRKDPETVDIVLYLHGHNNGEPWKDNPYSPISRYFKNPYFPLREHLAKAGKNVILIAPTLGERSESGILVTKGGFNTYISSIIDALKNLNVLSSWARVRHIVVAAHSGGGSPMYCILDTGDAMTQNIKECWAFDSLYKPQSPKLFADWAAKNPNKAFYTYYNSDKRGFTKNNACMLRKLATKKRLTNVFVPIDVAPASHMQIPIAYWATRIAASSFLDAI